MKKFLMFFIIITFGSCHNKEPLNIYTYESSSPGFVIRGFDLKPFFENTGKFYDITIHEIKMTPDLNSELRKLKSDINEKGVNDNHGGGIYYVAVVHGKDTLYASSSGQQWKYKNKVGEFKSNLIEKEIKRVLEISHKKNVSKLRESIK